MTDQTSWLFRLWDSRYEPGEVINVSTELGQLAMRIVFGALFGADPGDKAQQIEDIGIEANQLLGDFFRFPFPPLTWPTARNRRLRAIVGTLDSFVAEVVAARNLRGGEHHDLLEALLTSVDSETGLPMTESLLNREVLNLIVGGYETTSTSVAWLMYLVATHPEVQQRLRDEVDTVLDGRVPGFADLSSLTFTRMVVDEMLRMYTPAWQTMRGAVAEDEIGGYRIPARSNVYLNIYLLHRHPDFWPDPNRFDPDRFTPEQVAARPKLAYIPFGIGPRNCIGQHFARTELTLILAMIVQAYRLEYPAGRAPIEIEPLITLHPRGGVRLLLSRR